MEPFRRSIRACAGFLRVLAAGLAVLLSCVSPAGADIYRWVDEQGTIHFTDELSNVPPANRDTVEREVSESPERGGSLSVLGAPPAPPRGGPGDDASALPPEPWDPGPSREELRARIEQLKAKIDAKEGHIRAVDAKQSLAVNPLRNRFVDEADLALYRKYKEELPADLEELGALEEELSTLR